MNQKEAFIHYIQEFNINALESILPDNLILFGVSKETFINGLKKIYSNNGYCAKGDFLIRKTRFQPNLYIFYSNLQGTREKFYIYCDENQNIVKLKNYKSKKNSFNFDCSLETGICFGDDEKIGFIKDDTYLNNLELAKIASDEIISAEKKVLSSEEIGVLLKKFKELNDYCINNYRYVNFISFRDLYFEYEFLYSIVINSGEAKQALIEYHTRSFDSIEDWYSKYYRLAHCKVGQFYQSLIDIDYDVKLVKSFSNKYYRGEDFINVYEFSDLYFNNTDSFINLDSSSL